MGNSGSIHNLHFEGAKSELGSYLQNQSQPLRRSNNKEIGLNSSYKYNASNLQSPLHSTEWRRSLGNPSAGKDSHTQFKVLPKLNERTHLRATTNGAILHSGGTISGRRDVKQFDNTLPIGIGMQRSRTFIDEPTTKDCDFLRTEKKHNGITPEFNRSQTMLHVKVKSNKAEKDAILDKGSNLKPMQRHTYSEPDFCHTTKKAFTPDAKKMEASDTFTKPGKINKYNKKRRAPQAPTSVVASQTLPIEKESTQIAYSSHPQMKQQLFAKQYDRAKQDGFPRIATEKVTRGPKINERQQHAYTSKESFQRGNLVRNSMSSSQFQSQKLPTESQTKIPFRREKSSDAILLKNRNEKKISAGANHNENLRPFLKSREQQNTSDQRHSIKNLKEDQTNAIQKPGSKIPQLKRTFYFGMDNATNAQKSTSIPVANRVESPEKILEDANKTAFDLDSNENEKAMGSLPHIRSYDINIDKTNCFEDINDNGIMVHVRPTMPRRQFDTPSFSPSLAWRTLVKEQENLLRSTIPKTIGYSAESDKSRIVMENNDQNLKLDSPIRAIRVPKLRQIQKPSLLSKTWTPEQDLGDEDDEAEAILDVCDESSSDDSKNDSDGFLFYGNKSGKSNNTTTPVHLFSLSLPRDAHIQNHLDSKALDKSHNYSSLQKARMDFPFKRSDSHSPTGRITSDLQFELKNKTLTKFDAGNNWVLYKNTSDSAGRAKGHLESDDKLDKVPSIEPMSLKMLTGGKHLMYLPGHHEKSIGSLGASRENISFMTKTVSNESSNEQRQSKRRPKDLRESLQDATPVYPGAQLKSHASINLLADEDKPFHQRFTFQSTVRLLEKRRLAEKLSRDAEIKEAQRKSEIEALKRVEEDFQRKRANEKANIRNQLQLYFGGNDDSRERYQSLPLAISAMDGFSSSGLNDTNNNNYNNNICCRDEPDGCVSSSQLPTPEKELCSSDYVNKV